jgi:NAD(P)-dependent dehydrogenase (short-subunit alcohol dehydrogenase family)
MRLYFSTSGTFGIRKNETFFIENQPKKKGLIMDLKLTGKTAIVTGGSAGIGLAIAGTLAEEGVQVVVPGRNIKKVNEAIAALPGKLTAVEADLGTADGAKKLIAQVPEIDILVNNLGIYESKDFTEITDDDWFHYFEVNLLGGIRLARHYFPQMLKRNSGRLIFVSSEAAAEVHPDMIHYGVTKTGQVVVARGLAEMTKGTRVTVNSVLPGPTRSEAIVEYLKSRVSNPNASSAEVEAEYFRKERPTSLIQRMAENTEVASLVTYLASPLAANTNGAALRCEGGILRTIF